MSIFPQQFINFFLKNISNKIFDLTIQDIVDSNKVNTFREGLKDDNSYELLVDIPDFFFYKLD
jgi:hypothetical protein